ncbi:glycosyltransferase [Desulfatirhabdium butyrativorans]|uniref:glycosyltransferase n=1 Tax=Desulfatirhabdium butyrativorans TaxID=340467 RepID=UPI000410A70E|nr:glycosyltransferase [Desulfatirhabdium butyrativorans]
MPTRVLHIGKYYPPIAGGIENFLFDLLPALVGHRIEPALLVHEDRKAPYPPGTFDGIPAFCAPAYGTLLYAPVSPRFPQCLQQAIVRFRPDLLHIHVPNTSAFWALLLPAARRLPWIVHWHADVVASEVDRRMAQAYHLYKLIESCLLARSWRIVTTSHAYLHSSPTLSPWREKCRVIPLGLDPSAAGQGRVF